MTSHLLRSTERSELLNSFDVGIDSISLTERKDQEAHAGVAIDYSYDLNPTATLTHGSALHFNIPSYDYLRGLSLSYKFTGTAGVSDKAFDGNAGVDDDTNASKPSVFKFTENFGANYWSSIVLQTQSGRTLLTLYPDTTAYLWKNQEKNMVARYDDISYGTQVYEDMNSTTYSGTVTLFDTPAAADTATRSTGFINGANRSTALNANDFSKFEAISPLPFEIFERVKSWYDSNWFEGLKLTVNLRNGTDYAFKYNTTGLVKAKIDAVPTGVSVNLRCHYTRRPVEVVEKIRSKSFESSLTNMLTYDWFQEVGKTAVAGDAGAQTVDLKCKNLIRQTFVFAHATVDANFGDPGKLSNVSMIRFLDGAQELGSWSKRQLKLERRDIVDTSEAMYVLDWSDARVGASGAMMKPEFDVSGISLMELGAPRLEITLEDTSAATYDIGVYHQYVKTLTFDKDSRRVEAPAVQ